MTPEAQRIAIAEACGFECDQHGCESRHWHSKSGQVFYLIDLPNYCCDLNAMHEAEKTLMRDAREWRKYCDYLHGAQCGWNITATMDLVHLSAAQRAEAFLRTLNLWTTK